MDNLNLSWELAGRLAGKSPDELKEALISEGEEGEKKFAENYLDNFHNLVLDKFKGAEREKIQGEVGRTLKERMQKLEGAAKPIFEALELEMNASDFEGSLQKLSEKIQKTDPPKGGSKELTVDELKKLPAFQNVLDSEVSALNEKLANIQNEYEQYKTQIQQRENRNIISKHTSKILNDSKAVWGEFPDEQLRIFISSLDHGEYNLSLDDKGNPILLDSDGNQARDDYKNKIDYKDWVLKRWKMAGHTFHSAPENSNSVGGKRSQENGSKFNITVSSKEDYERLLGKFINDPAKKSAVRRAWAEFQAKGS